MDKMIYGVDLPKEIIDKNDEIAMKMFGLTEEDIKNIDIDETNKDTK